MKIKDFLDKDYDYVSYRLTLPEWSDECLLNWNSIYDNSTFAGSFEILNGKIYPFDEDFYGEDEEVLWYEEWSKDDVKNGLTIVVETDWICG